MISEVVRYVRNLRCTQRKLALEHSNGGLEHDFPFQHGVKFKFQPFKTPGH